MATRIGSKESEHPAADEIVDAGERAMPFITEVLKGGWSSPAHPVDILEAFSYLAKRIRAQGGSDSRSAPHNS